MIINPPKITCILLASIFTLFSTSAAAFFVDAGALANDAREYEKAKTQTAGVDWERVKSYSSYVTGVYDTLDLSDLLCDYSKQSITRGQINSIVSKYLSNNPEQWHRPAAIVVIESLRTTFCSNAKQ